MNSNKSKKHSGFTLIELLVSMGIIAVLTGMAAFNLNLSRIRSRDVQRKNDVDQLQKAMEVYKNDTGSYPVGSFQDTLISQLYIKKSFNDPMGNLTWVDYQYLPESQDNPKNYYLMACLENAVDSARTTSFAQCALFGGSGNSCKCGQSAKTGTMYIVSQP